MGFQAVVFLPSCAGFCTTFRNNCCRGKRLGTTTCLKTVVGLSKGMLPVEFLHPNKFYFYVSLIFLTSHDCYNISVNLNLGILPDLKQWCLVVCLRSPMHRVIV